MRRSTFDVWLAAIGMSAACMAQAGQAPGSTASADVPMSHRDRVYAAEQFSNTVSVTDPVANKLLGVIRLGDPTPANISPLYRGQVLVHGMGFSPDHRTIAVVSVGSNSVTFIDTATNAIKHTTYVGRSPHEAFFTPDGKEVWVTVRGEAHVAILDAATFAEVGRIATPNGPGMQIFSPDGAYAYICSSFTPETIVVSVPTREIVGRVRQDSSFCPNIAATPDGKQVWLTLKDVGRTTVFAARPPFEVIKSFATGPVTNHVNFAVTRGRGMLAYITVGGSNQVKVYRTDDFSLIKIIDVGKLPHGIWPSGDGTRMYLGLENGDALQAIDTESNTVVAEVAIGQAPQAVNYVSGAVPTGDGLQGLEPIGIAGEVVHVELTPANASPSNHARPTSVALFNQGLVQVLEASVTGLVPMQTYVLALSGRPDGDGELQPLAAFKTNAAGAAIVNTVGPIRQIVQPRHTADKRYLVIAPTADGWPGRSVQVQVR